jgi:tRNA(fMet)-specific endonuclease VapC
LAVILDSSVLIADERGRFALQDFFAAHSSESFHLAAITVSELWHGVERAAPATRRQARETHVRQHLAHLNVLGFDAEVARRHAAVWAALETRGALIGSHDLQIAATALHHGHPLLTLNAKEFQRVGSLQLVDVNPYVRH